MKRRASRVIVPPQDSFGDDFIEEDEYGQGNRPLDKNRPDRKRREYVQPVGWVVQIALPKPPSEHSQELEGKQEGYQPIKPPPQSNLIVWSGDDLQSEIFGAKLEESDKPKDQTQS